MDYLFVVIGIMILPALAQLYITTTYKKYLNVNSSKNMSGFDVARKILDSNGLNDLYIVETEGTLTDHYDPSKNVVRLSHDIFHKNTISSISVAAHECGHAIQNKEGYFMMKLRTLFVPVVNFSSNIGYILLVIGFALASEKSNGTLVNVALILLSSSVLFQLITLPVEINASRRAKKQLIELNLISSEEESQVTHMLTAAALTYVAGLLSSLLELLRLVMIFSRRND